MVQTNGVTTKDRFFNVKKLHATVAVTEGERPDSAIWVTWALLEADLKLFSCPSTAVSFTSSAV